MRRIAVILLFAALAGCNLSPGQYFIIAMTTAEQVAATSLITLTDAQLAEHRALVADMAAVTNQVDHALMTHLEAVDAEIARRAAS